MITVGIIGRNGQLGRELIRRTPPEGLALAAFGRAECDIADANAVEKCLKGRGLDLIVNAAAYTAVDQAEREAARAHAVNALGPANLAAFCARQDIPLIHISTDYVFDGTQDVPYRERDPIAPLGVYGKTKAKGEEHVRTSCPHHIIIRTSWLYSATGNNFVKTMLRLGREKTVLKVVDDQHGCPTSAADLADAVWRVISTIRRNDRPRWGTYHFCNRGETTWHGLAQAVFERAGTYPDCPLQVRRVIPITTSEYPTPARRPVYSVLNCDLIQTTFAMTIRDWQAALHDTMDELISHTK